MMTTDAKIFIDTNILLRLHHAEFGLYEKAFSLLTNWRANENQIWISRQIIREYVAQVTRPGNVTKPLSGTEIERQIRAFQLMFTIADETEPVTEKLIELLKRYPTGGKQVHDLNIVATMLVNGIDTLATTNYEDLKRFEGLIKIIHVEQTS